MKRYLYILSFAVLIIFAIIGYNWVRDNRMSNFDHMTELYVRPDEPADSVLAELSRNAVSAKSMTRMFRSKDVAEYIKPGHYTVSKGNTSVYVARMLNNCWQTPVNLTLSGSMRSKGDIARKISRQMLVDSASVAAALNDNDLLGKFGTNSRDVFSLFIPDTYQVYWTATPEEILEVQKRAYDAFWTDENVAKANALGLSRQQVSTIASIVKGESNYEPEYPKIAGVYINRYKIGMRLQADPTIAYCYDYKLGRIMRSHLAVESPYNTYKYAGLPPGPICVPTKACLLAVLDADYGTASGKPGKGGNLYFCASPEFNGTHLFAKDYGTHQQNARAFQKALTKRLAEKKANK